MAFGALGPGGVQVLNEMVASGLSADDRAEVRQREQAELDRRERLYRAGRPPLELTGRTAVIVDDGLATGATARAAVQVARHLGAARVVVAVPVGSQQAYEMVAAEADQVVCAQHPAGLQCGQRLLRRLPRGLRRRGHGGADRDRVS